MTEYEYLDFLTSSVDVIVQSGFNFISVFFAYIACAYVVGTKLSLMKSTALTLAYTIYLGINIMTIVTTLERMIDASSKHALDSVGRFETMQVLGPSLLAFIWVLSVVYMFSQYRDGKNNEQVEVLR